MEYSSYRPAVVSSGAILAALGIAELVSSCFVAASSGGNYIGAIYCGIMCLLSGCLSFRPLLNRSALLLLLCTSVASAILSMVATALQSGYYHTLSSLQACSTYQSGAGSTCGSGATGYLCYGEQDYYAQAASCMVAYQDRLFSTSSSSNECTCISSDGTSCYDYSHVPSCNDFTNKLPEQMKISYIIAFVCLLGSLVSLVSVCVALRGGRSETTLSQPIVAVRADGSPTLVAVVQSPLAGADHA